MSYEQWSTSYRFITSLSFVMVKSDDNWSKSNMADKEESLFGRKIEDHESHKSLYQETLKMLPKWFFLQNKNLVSNKRHLCSNMATFLLEWYSGVPIGFMSPYWTSFSFNKKRWSNFMMMNFLDKLSLSQLSTDHELDWFDVRFSLFGVWL
jgi:hypothetical protein